ncbi:hypothetical protein Desku_3219 [Desulfofundulus kuznetsovii DSM 6115]|uniref:Uncharacterized protein n=1 Tax=Desulfofundulus kuznetsovii (strain DSM 6115 / VKM B-1805 / 17) TaxID=760568 RepID=A0AAU8PCN9_DESK7|nr:hypothetical protein Desku_3219 [Desulfofundulus kuznetsovii DSM 6115]
MLRLWGKKVVLVLSLLVAAAGIVLATLFLPVMVGTGPEKTRVVRLGHPFWFVVQDQSKYSPPGDVQPLAFSPRGSVPSRWYGGVFRQLALSLIMAAFLLRRAKSC